VYNSNIWLYNTSQLLQHLLYIKVNLWLYNTSQLLQHLLCILAICGCITHLNCYSSCCIYSQSVAVKHISTVTSPVVYKINLWLYNTSQLLQHLLCIMAVFGCITHLNSYSTCCIYSVNLWLYNTSQLLQHLLYRMPICGCITHLNR